MSQSIATIIQLLETLPVTVQDNIADHVKSYIEDLERDQKWESMFLKVQNTFTNVKTKPFSLK